MASGPRTIVAPPPACRAPLPFPAPLGRAPRPSSAPPDPPSPDRRPLLTLRRTTQHYAGGLYDKDVWNLRNTRTAGGPTGGPVPGVLQSAPGEWTYDW